MTDNVIHLPPQPKPVEFIIGPFTEYKVVIEGRVIPNLTALKLEDGGVSLIVDNRFSATFSPDDAYQAAWLIANAMAVSAGYPCLSSNTREQPFAPQVMHLGNLPDEAP